MLCRGVDIACLDTSKQWQFTPANFREGQIISGGDIFGTVSVYFRDKFHEFEN